MYRTGLAALAAAVALGCGTTNTASAPRRTQVVVVSSIQTGDLDRLVCRRVREVGTHIHRRQCRTQRQINEEMQRTQDEILLGLYKIQGM